MILSSFLLVAALAAATAAVFVRRLSASAGNKAGRVRNDNGWSLVLTFDAILMLTTAVMLPLTGTW